MSNRLSRILFSAPAIRPLSRLLFLSSLCGTISLTACSKNEPEQPEGVTVADSHGAVVYETDTSEWRVCIVATGMLYSDAVQVSLPAPWQIPTREDAAVLRTLTYPHNERFVTSDGYTFGMPSASVNKAGAKTKYSVLGLHKRPTVIVVEF